MGDIVYHQPKASINTNDRTYLSQYEKIAQYIHENEKLSPLWIIAKKSHKQHISNSNFTKKLVRELYGINSNVIYPPVDLNEYLTIDTKKQRTKSILIVRPKGITGITYLQNALKNIDKTTQITVIGKIDKIGETTIHRLQNNGYNIQYLGYITQEKKNQIFSETSHYLHLSRNEPFGITVIEAMASGCIPIAPNQGGIPEYLPTQYLYNELDEIPTIFNNTQLSEETAKNKLREITKKYSTEVFQKQIIETVKSQINQSF